MSRQDRSTWNSEGTVTATDMTGSRTTGPAAWAAPLKAYTDASLKASSLLSTACAAPSVSTTFTPCTAGGFRWLASCAFECGVSRQQDTEPWSACARRASRQSHPHPLQSECRHVAAELYEITPQSYGVLRQSITARHKVDAKDTG